MKTFNKWFFLILIFVAIAPTVLQLLVATLAQMDPNLIILLFGLVVLWLMLKYGVFRDALAVIFSVIGNTLRFMASGFSRDAHWMPFWERWKFLSPTNKGLVVDGVNRLSEEHSYQNLIAVAPVGGGKTSNIPIPHALVADNTSLVFTDLSGELFEYTSGALKKRGYDLQVLDLMNIGQGHYFNPLEGLKIHTEIARVSEVIISSSGLTENNKDPFWAIGAQNVIKVFLQALANLNRPEYLNLANLKYLVNNFSMSGSLDQFMIQATLDDEPTYQEYKGFLADNENTVNSLITTAQTALSGLNPDMARVTAKNTIDFDELRQRKIALYVMVRQQDIAYLGFIVNLFFTKLCHTLLNDLDYSKNGLPVHLCLDEFGQFYIPGFETFAATSRKYRVAFCVLLQSLSQLTTRYGADKAQTILCAVNSEQYFSGMPINLASEISRRIGQKTGTHDKQQPLIREHEVIRLKQNEAIFLHSGRDPIKLKLTPYYKQQKLRRLSNLPPETIPQSPLPEIQYVQLKPSIFSALDTTAKPEPEVVNDISSSEFAHAPSEPLQEADLSTAATNETND